jgi:hypothetical protein
MEANTQSFKLDELAIDEIDDVRCHPRTDGSQATTWPPPASRKQGPYPFTAPDMPST